jgi:hypothetical protein
MLKINLMDKYYRLPSKECLERQKLAAELIKLRSDIKYGLIRTVFSGIQLLAIIIGVYLGVNEFIIKDRAQEAQHQSITLKLVEIGDSESVNSARDALIRIRDDVYTVPCNKKEEIKRFPDIVERFERETRDLSSYYRSLSRGIKAGYLDEDLVVALIADDIRLVGDIIDEIIGRLGPPGYKTIHPDLNLKPFCGFFALREKLEEKQFWKKNWAIDPCERL